MYGLVKTQKVNNPVRVITSSCNTAIENLSIYIKHVLFKIFYFIHVLCEMHLRC